jgi:threonine dehydrogenase-like Zn-dependent dehydrogenase
VYAIDLDPARLALAAEAGATTIDAIHTNPEMALARETDDRGADVVIDAVGAPAAYESAIGIARRGGRVVVVGTYAGEVAEMQLGVYWARALDVRFAGLCPVHHYWERAMTMLAAGRVDPLPVVSHRLPLEDAPKGYDLFDRREASKVLLHP